MLKENRFLEIINSTISNNSLLGDDCAYLDDFGLLISQDTLVEGVHFKNSYFTPEEIGKKAILVNISDILANGGAPEFVSVSLSGPLNEDFVQNFYKGVNFICEKYNIKITGGDLTGGDKIVVSVCILGKNKNKFIPKRKNAKPGDLVFLKGYHGSSAMGLKMLLSGNYKENEYIKAHKEPILYPEVSNYISKNVSCPYVMMDTSDGLFDALQKVSENSNVGFEIEYDKIPKKIKDKNLVLFGGEDFGLFICLNPKDAHLAIELALPQIGKVTNSKQILIDNEILENKSFNHFE